MPIYEQSMNVRDMILVWWRTTWRILASWAMHTSGLAAMKIAEIGNLWYKFTPKGYIPLSDFYKIWRGEGVSGPHNHAKFCHCGFKKCGLRASEIAKISNFSYKFAQ